VTSVAAQGALDLGQDQVAGTVSADGRARITAVAAAATAAYLHLVVTPEHLAEWWVYGVFFFVVAWGQAVLAWSVLRRSGRLATLLLGIAGTFAVVGISLLSRTVGLPLVHPGGASPAGAAGLTAHHLGHPGTAVTAVPGSSGEGMPIMPGAVPTAHLEGVGPLDSLTLVAELVLVVALVALLPDRSRAVVTNLMLLAGLVILGVRAVGAVG
jgi:hypothetical protein